MRMTLGRASSERGFTMILVVMVMLAAMGFGFAAYAAAGGDVQLTQRNSNAKRAYAGAEAGLAFYLQKLAQDNEYWTKCDQGDPPGTTPRSPVNQPRTGAPDNRQWRALPTDTQVEFTIELLPVAPATACVPGDDKTMLADDGTLKIRTSGRVGPAGRQVKRSIVTSFRRKGFLDYLYFSDFETSDPLQQELDPPNNLSNNIPLKRATTQADARSGGVPTSIATWADQPSTCRRYVPQRDAVRFAAADTNGRFGYGFFDPDGPGGSRPTDWYRTNDSALGDGVDIRCSTIRFAEGDDVKGPFHSNDTIMVCDSPSFGRDDAVDDVEYFAWRPDPDCDGSSPDLGPSQEKTNANGLYIPRTFPDSNVELSASVEDEYHFYGKTTIELQGTQMRVTSGGTTTTKPMPPTGLVYVSSSGTAGACPPFDPKFPYAAGRDACGDAYVSGTYAKNLSIATQGDVVVTGDVTMSGGNALLGLIAQNFVRVFHPVANPTSRCGAGTANATGTGTNRRIEAAILSVDHVFTVDNYQCGPKLETLTVKGGIAQRYRGPVATGGSSSGTGYTKNYEYDQRLRYRSPPFFLAPAKASWRVLRSTEQSPAT